MLSLEREVDVRERLDGGHLVEAEKVSLLIARAGARSPNRERWSFHALWKLCSSIMYTGHGIRLIRKNDVLHRGD